MPISSKLLDILRCPESGAPLVLDGEFLVSQDAVTRRRFGIIEGIPNMILTDAETLPENEWLEIMERHGKAPKNGGASS